MKWNAFRTEDNWFPEMRALSKADHLKISSYCLRKSFRRGEVQCATILLATIWIGPALLLLLTIDTLDFKVGVAFFAQWLVMGNAALLMWIFYRHEVTRALIPDAMRAFRAGELR